MAQWMGKIGFELQPLADYVLERFRQPERVFADVTSPPILTPGSRRGNCHDNAVTESFVNLLKRERTRRRT